MSGPSSALIREQCGSLGNVVSYSRDDGNKIVRLCPARSLSTSITEKFKDVFKEVFLPYGYPDSVSDDYFSYQIWDTLQAFCSTITGTFTTQAILKGVGVGNAEASPLAAAITWVLKDGTGMLGRIIFAWWKGNSLDADCKKWRLFADVINDTAMCFELTVPYFPEHSMEILCLTTTMKAVVGVAGGATRASITQHQAIKGNMADVSAKDGSQETCVNLVASIVGILLLAAFNEGEHDWLIFVIFATLHLIANYLAVHSLIFKHLNSARLLLLIKMYLKFDTVMSPANINKAESLILGFGIKAKKLCGYNIKLGCSLQSVAARTSADEFMDILTVYGSKNYIIVPNFKTKTLCVVMRNEETSQDVISAYFHAVMTGIALSKYNKEHMHIQMKRHLHQVTPLTRLNTAMKEFPQNTSGELRNLPLSAMEEFNDYINFELANFFIAMKVNGWNVNTHALEVGSWRYVQNEDTSSSRSRKKSQ